MYFTSGAVYDGQWKFDKMTGHGTLKLPDGSIQEGSWRDGKLHGCAVFTWPHGVCEYREYDEKQGVVSVITLIYFLLEGVGMGKGRDGGWGKMT